MQQLTINITFNLVTFEFKIKEQFQFIYKNHIKIVIIRHYIIFKIYLFYRTSKSLQL